MIEIKSLMFRNFRSYGDYDTFIELDGLGPILIVGELESGQQEDSNGAGKSTIVDAIVWCLFNRLPSKDRPGDGVVNIETGKNCIVRIVTKNGYTIERTRKYDGHNDLIIKRPDGEDISDSTTTNAQKHLNRLFNLDYNIFMSTTFFAQFSQPLLMLSEPKRRKALEKMLGIDKFDFLVEAANEKITTAKSEQLKHNVTAEQLKHEAVRLGKQIENNLKEKERYETEREEKIGKVRNRLSSLDPIYEDKKIESLDRLKEARRELEQIKTHDLKALENEWESHNKKIEQLGKNRKEVTKQREETSRLEARKVALEEIDKTDFSERADKLVLQYKAAKLKLIEAKQYDLEGIKKSWSDYSKQEKERDDKIAPLKSEKTELEKQLWAASEDVDKWNRLSDNTCPECEQDVSVELAVRRRVYYQKEEDKLKKKIAKIEKQLKEFEKNIIEPPEITVQQAEVTNARYEDLASAVSEAKEAIRDLAKEKEEADEKQDERKNDITNLEGQIQANRDEITLSEKALDRQEDKLEKSKPGVTLNEALAIRSQYDAKSGEVAVLEESLNNLDQQKKSEKESCEDEVRKLREEENPFERVISDLEKDLEDIRSQYSGAEKKVNLFDSLISHIEYIRKSYSDRRKIKAFIVKKMISFLNEMIYYHLRALQCDFTLEFNEFLQAKTGTYPYELWSGGERRRIDLALMFATYKLNKSIHGQSSNIIVFDEVERSLDKSGMRALTELIFREFSDKSVVVISHTDELRDVFPSKIVVKRASRHNSRIEEIR